MKRQSVLSSVTNDVTKGLIAFIREAKQLTPNVVYAYASLMLRDDEGLPIVPAPHHLVWLSLLCDENIKKLLIISPPDSAKTTWAVQGYLGCRLGFYPDQNIVIGAVTDDVAEKRSLVLRNTVESDLWKLIFPSVEKNEKLKWEQSEWSIKSKRNMSERLHPTLRSYGTNSASVTGSRADFLMGDDLLSKENTATQGQRQKFEDWMDSQFLTRRKPKGRTVLIGTSWNAADYYAKLRRNSLGWVVCVCQSYQENGFYLHLYYPENWTGILIGQSAFTMPEDGTGTIETRI